MLSNQEQVNLTITYALLLDGKLTKVAERQWVCSNAIDWRSGDTEYVAAARYLEGVCGYYLHTNGTLMKCP